MSAYAPFLIVLGLWLLMLAIGVRFLASLGLPVGWATLGGLARLVWRVVAGLLRFVIHLVAGTIRLIRRERRAMPLPTYTTIRLPRTSRQDELEF